MEKFRAPRSRAVFGGTAPARVRCGHTWGRRSLAAPELRQSRLCRRQGLGGSVALWGPVVAPSPGVRMSAVSAGERGSRAGACAAGGRTSGALS